MSLYRVSQKNFVNSPAPIALPNNATGVVINLYEGSLKTASVLFFEIGNRKVFAKEVHHPGTRARPFLREAIEQVTKNP